MENQPNQPQRLCQKCSKRIILSNFILHELRCKGPATSSRINPNRNNPQMFPNSSRISRSSHNRSLNQQENIPCHFCGHPMTLAELDTHPANCQHKQQLCEECHSSFPRSLMQQHKIVCDARRQPEHQHDWSSEQMEYEQEGLDPRQLHRYHVVNQPINPFQALLEDHPLFPNQNRRRNNPFDIMRPRQESYIRFQFGSGNRNRRRQNLPQQNSFERVNPIFQLIQLIASRRNRNSHPGLRKQEIEKLQKVKYHQKQGSQNDLCTICYCQFQQGEQINKLKCNHLYHHECIGKWLQTNASCPVCKRSTIPEKRESQPQGPGPQDIRGQINRILF